MQRQDLQKLSREELIREAERAGVPRPRVLTQAELVDEILKRTASSDKDRTRSRGWLGRARDLLANVVEKGLHLPDAAAAIRGGSKGWPPPPPPPLPTVTLAEIYAAQGHIERAVAVLDEVLQREPEHQEARELRERFVAQLARGSAGPEPAKSAPAAPAEASPADAAQPADEAEAAQPEGEGAAPPVSAPPTLIVSPREAPPVPAVEAAAAPASAPAQQPGESPAPEAQARGAAPGPEVEETLHSSDSGESPAPEAEVDVAAAISVAQLTTRSAQADGAVTIVTAAAIEASAVEATSVEASAAPAAEEPAAAEPAAVEPAAAEPPAIEPAAAEPPAIEPAAAQAAEIENTLKTEGVTSPAGLRDRHDTDEVVALAVDPSTFYVYWEVRPTTFAHCVVESPGGMLVLRVVAVTPGWDGAIVESRDIAIDALFGDRFIHHVRPRADVRVSIGWLVGERFDPIAVGAEISAPRAFVAAGAPAPGGAPLDLSEGLHAAPAPFVSTAFAHAVQRTTGEGVPERAAERIAAGWVPRELFGAAIEGSADRAAGPLEWVWVPRTEAFVAVASFGPASGGLFGPMERGEPWGGASEGGPWGGASEGGPWGGAS